MAKCLIIGGGFAGLSAAAFLAEKGIKIQLLEASPKLGGRAYSFSPQKINSNHELKNVYKRSFNVKILELTTVSRNKYFFKIIRKF